MPHGIARKANIEFTRGIRLPSEEIDDLQTKLVMAIVQNVTDSRVRAAIGVSLQQAGLLTTLTPHRDAS